MGEVRADGEGMAQWSEVGTNSFACLTGMIRATDPLWKRVLMALNASQSIIRFPVIPAGLVRARAVAGYTALGSAASDNVPVLIRMMELESSPHVRASIAAALGDIGPGAKPAIPVLQKAAQDKNPEVRQNALFALGNILMWVPDDARISLS